MTGPGRQDPFALGRRPPGLPCGTCWGAAGLPEGSGTGWRPRQGQRGHAGTGGASLRPGTPWLSACPSPRLPQIGDPRPPPGRQADRRPRALRSDRGVPCAVSDSPVPLRGRPRWTGRRGTPCCTPTRGRPGLGVPRAQGASTPRPASSPESPAPPEPSCPPKPRRGAGAGVRAAEGKGEQSSSWADGPARPAGSERKVRAAAWSPVSARVGRRGARGTGVRAEQPPQSVCERVQRPARPPQRAQPPGATQGPPNAAGPPPPGSVPARRPRASPGRRSHRWGPPESAPLGGGSRAAPRVRAGGSVPPGHRPLQRGRPSGRERPAVPPAAASLRLLLRPRPPPRGDTPRPLRPPRCPPRCPLRPRPAGRARGGPGRPPVMTRRGSQWPDWRWGSGRVPVMPAHGERGGLGRGGRV